MQILSNALPGFRDLRAPVVAGYMWLVFAWLVVQPDIDQRPDNALGAALFDLGQDVGRVWVWIGVGVVAYLVGSISVVVTDVFGRAAFELSGAGMSAAGTHEEGLEQVYVQGRNMLEEVRGRIPSAHAEQLRELLEHRAGRAREEAKRELDLPAILLVGDQPELFAEVDRLRSEGELRTAVSLPLIALSLLCAVAVSRWWLLVIPAVLVLFWQGVNKDISARISIANAIRIGKASSVASSRFSEWVERDFAERVREAQQASSYNPADDRPPTAMERLQGHGAMD